MAHSAPAGRFLHSHVWFEATVLDKTAPGVWYPSSKCTSSLLEPFHWWEPHCHLKPGITKRKLLTFQTTSLCSLFLLVIPPALKSTVSEIWFFFLFVVYYVISSYFYLKIPLNLFSFPAPFPLCLPFLQVSSFVVSLFLTFFYLKLLISSSFSLRSLVPGALVLVCLRGLAPPPPSSCLPTASPPLSHRLHILSILSALSSFTSFFSCSVINAFYFIAYFHV